MDFEAPTRAHEGEIASVFKASERKCGYAERKESTYHCCTYCGSISLADALKAMQLKGAHYSGSDWKYGYPHKLYLKVPCEPYQAVVMSSTDGKGRHTTEMGEKTSHNHKFYTKHVIDADPDTIRQWNRIAAPLIGVAYGLHPENGSVGYFSVHHGWQTWGVAGVKREDLPEATSEVRPGGGNAAMESWMKTADCLFGPEVPKEFLDLIPEEWR